MKVDDPFDPAADPYPPATDLRRPATPEISESRPHPCHCRGDAASPGRRQALLGFGALALLPVAAAADPFPVPCVQERQRITPCRHKYCRHYAGEGDYHGR